METGLLVIRKPLFRRDGNRLSLRMRLRTMHNLILKDVNMTIYGGILRLASMRISQANIAVNCNISNKTVNMVLHLAKKT